MSPSEDDTPRFEEIAPEFGVADLARSADYYRGVLGFDLERYEEFRFAFAARDGLRIGLQEVEDPPADADPERGSRDAYVWTDDADALYAEFEDAGAEFVFGPRDRPYGQREFGVADPDGHLVVFGAPRG